MIAITGGAGFIGSALAWRLNKLGRNDIYIIDELGTGEKWKNLVGLDFNDFIDKNEFIEKWVNKLDSADITAIIHMGANSSTTEKDADFLLKNNYRYTVSLAQAALWNNIRFIYASSAATYGDGKLGFNDNESLIPALRPLNMYGYSKNLFDIYALKNGLLDRIVGIKYFNVYGPNEYHKGDMRSVVNKAFEQILTTGKVKLFTSKNPGYKDGEQLRDFIYIKDAVDMTLHFLLKNKKAAGIFNVGTAKARHWNDLAKAIFKTLNKPVNIEYIELPSHLEKKYQYYTQADITKLKNSGYKKRITSLEDGVRDYVSNYLVGEKYLDGLD
ncbi:MAG: ADP-glyceromanno-heptose 6-epimerase [Ignavibacteriales bacterium]|jgi:ADP-L-glycero-D-manno-heptose 6-epimerase|nr:ADP-glyceromanno-heptose 6-epimerase [Ignavibacteriaceae bacterium]NLH62412.1 ADP-glyceromanno-heptose 6-epimerase [Ignavibacteriales bacterium]HPO56744.1 ADP-glyceromanno-heptose 6-epimerase [Ignavibacteriaceae bacterium]